MIREAVLLQFMMEMGRVKVKLERKTGKRSSRRRQLALCQTCNLSKMNSVLKSLCVEYGPDGEIE